MSQTTPTPEPTQRKPGESEADYTFRWLKEHKDKIMVCTIVVLGLKNRKLRARNIYLLTRTREMAAINHALVKLIQGAGH
jgi:ATP-dependent exoDNAse (exonuclease V) beta subunit